MIDLDIINGTIAEWEAKELTFVVVERLAWLYVVRDHVLMNIKQEEPEPVTMPKVAISSGSDFMNACSNAEPIALWSTLDELMNSVQLLQPKLYQATIEKIKGL